MKAGAAMIDITPPLGTHLGGAWGTLRPAQTIADRLYARALVLQNGAGRKMCFVCPDLEVGVKKYTDRIRRAASEKCGIEFDAVMVHLAQSHSTPPLGNFLIDDDFQNVPPEHEYLRGAQSEYCEFATAKIIESIVAADANLRPVEIAAASAARGGLAFNRRGVMRDGKVCMPWLYSGVQKPLGPTDIRYLEGPDDPEVGVVALRDAESKEMVAMLLHFTCHPVNMFATYTHVVTSDWPGTWAAEVQTAHGADCVPLVLNGCCGNINPCPAFEPDFFPDHRRMGRALAEATDKVIRTMKFESDDTLDLRIKHLPLPLKKPDAATLASAEKILAENPSPQWIGEGADKRVAAEWGDAAWVMSVELERRRSPNFDYEIQAFCVGDVALVGLPGEPFVEGQLEIKIQSPFYPTYVAHGTGDYAGYIAPKSSYPRGGHEIRSMPAKWTRIESGALERIVEESGKLLNALHAARSAR